MNSYLATCLCGAVALEIQGGIEAIIHCHCSKCRKSSGTAFATNGYIRSAGLRITRGEQSIRGYEVTAGRSRHFCGVCASPLFSSNAADPDRLRLRLGILDSDISERPISHNFVSSKASWEELDAELPRYDGHEPGR
ncbi:GFA family protein [Roseateles oligotrophus]|uniref:GFA family protein n=1 Tax=Roseateles oligotrophus TaxID=1769250 RepID=A0ABT2YEE8_9BURK|nr:GFA family protein [Roseateles oligotrophus]MCV2368417.1 GFA family protein [Roseateles oligotrophus]